MKKHLASGITALAVGILVWATTTSLQLLEPLWRIAFALGVALIAAFCIYLLSNSSQKEKKREVLSQIKSRGNMTFDGVRINDSDRSKSNSIASHLSARGDATFKNVDVNQPPVDRSSSANTSVDQKRNQQSKPDDLEPS